MSNFDCQGFCRDCGKTHMLPAEPALDAAKELLARVYAYGSVGLDLCDNPRYSLDYLFGPARGQMFGVMTYIDRRGVSGVLRAFSGQYNGIWQIPGWVGPVIDEDAFMALTADGEREIKTLGRKLEALSGDDPRRSVLIAQRKELSKILMFHIFDLYALQNFQGRTRKLRDVFLGTGMPTGTGECCAPKLLHHAARNGLKPTGLAEFYLGQTNRSGTKVSGHFYPPCAEKCAPILGFLLCGLDG